MPAKDGELKVQVAHVISSPEQLDEFLHWFTHWVWISQAELSDDIRRLAFQIQGMIYILDDGDFSDDEFMRRLQDVAHEFGIPALATLTGDRHVNRE